MQRYIVFIRFFVLSLIFTITAQESSVQAYPAQGTQAGASAELQLIETSILGTIGDASREWKLQDGDKVVGRAIVKDSEIVEIQRFPWRGKGPSSISVRIDQFSVKDQKELLSVLKADYSRYELYMLNQGAEVAPKWRGIMPQLASRCTSAIGIDGDDILFDASGYIGVVKKSDLTPESVAEIEKAIKKLKGQIALYNNYSPILAVGAPIHESDSHFVMEVIENNTRISPPFPVGTRYLFAKKVLSESKIRTLSAISQHVQKNFGLSPLTQVEVDSLPRLCKTGQGDLLVYPPKDASALSMDVSRLAGGQMFPMDPAKFCTQDHWWWETRRFSSIGPTEEKQIQESLIEAAEKRSYWNSLNHTPFPGKLLGSIANGFVFELQPTVLFFVASDELSNIDQTIARAASKRMSKDWIAKADLRTTMATRLFQSGSFLESATVSFETLKLNNAIVGDYPLVEYPKTPGSDPANVNEYRLQNYDNFRKAQQVQKWLKDHETLLQNADSNAIVASLSSEYSEFQKSEGSSSEAMNGSLPFDRKVRTWTFANGSQSFQAILVGMHEEDLVFEGKSKDKPAYFLASPSILNEKSLALAKRMTSVKDETDWKLKIAQDDKWQYYRVWYDPSGKVDTPSEPVVVEGISTSIINFRNLDGRVFTQRVPFDDEAFKFLQDFFEPAFQGAAKAKKDAEAGLTRWNFLDCEPELRAEWVASFGNNIRVRDVKGTEFLINGSCLDAEGRKWIASKDESATSDYDLAQMPRMWCTRTRLIGPAVPLDLTMDDRNLVYRTMAGAIEVLQLSDLTLREQLSFISEWRARHGGIQHRKELATVKSEEELDKLLSVKIDSKQQIKSCPPLTPEIEKELNDIFQSWKHPTWESEPIRLPADSELVTVDAKAESGIVVVDGKFSKVDFRSGKLASLAAITSDKTFGPWMTPDGSVVYWVSDGKLYSTEPGKSTKVAMLPEQTPPILAATQSSNWKYLVFYFENASICRFGFDGAKLDVIRGARNGTKEALNDPAIWTSMDGDAVLTFEGNANVYQVPGNIVRPELNALMITNMKPLNAVVGKTRTWIGNELPVREMILLTGSTTSLKPLPYGLPFQSTWQGIVQIDGEEVFQTIGQFEDSGSKKSNRAMVHYRGMRDFFELYATEWIEGEVDQRARMAANGSALVHWKGGKPTVSRRSSPPILSVRMQVLKVVERLVEQRNIGQLEAMSKYMERKHVREMGPFPGWFELEYQTLVKFACFEYQQQLAGDRLQRSIQLVEHFLERYPKSQVAANVLAEIQATLAWKARGGGFADTVTETGTKAFRNHMKEAYEILKPTLQDDPSAGNLRTAIDVAMASGRLDLARDLSKKMMESHHADNVQLHHAIQFLLLPRWHGKPGTSESYRDSIVDQLEEKPGNILYAQLVTHMLSVYGYGQPLSTQLKFDIERVGIGTEQYYETGTNSELIDTVILLMTMERKNEWVTRLLRLKSKLKLLPSQTGASNPQTFQSIEQKLGK